MVQLPQKDTNTLTPMPEHQLPFPDKTRASHLGKLAADFILGL